MIGAGTSGATLASRLSDDPARSVLLVEAGPDFPSEAVEPPALVVGGNLLGGHFAGSGAATPEQDWGYYGQPFAGGRRVHLVRGKLVGGSSMVNGCVAVRGKPSDFDDWEALGATGWSWSDVEPFFEAVEREVPIKRYPRSRWQPFHRTFADGFAELGYREVEDINAPDSWGRVIGAWPQNRHNEIRQGTLVTYVRRARGRENFSVLDRATVDRVNISDGRVTGIRYLRDGELRELEADMVVVAGGSYGTPPILLRSGVGPADDLRELGIEVHADLPVGHGLRDHPQTMFEFEVNPEQAEIWGPGFAVVARGEGWWSFPLVMDEAGTMAIAFALTSQEPQGFVKLASADPADNPIIQHNTQQVIDDNMFDQAFDDFRELCATSAFRAAGARGGDLDRPLIDTLNERLATAFHPSSSCAIGRVIDERLRVYGIEGLRVCDASIFPTDITNNTNLTCFMVGERAAALIDEDTAGRRGAEASAVRSLSAVHGRYRIAAGARRHDARRGDRRQRPLGRARRGAGLRRGVRHRDEQRPVHAAGTRVRAHRAGHARHRHRARVPAQPDGGGLHELGTSGPQRRPLRARPRHPGARARGAPLRRHLVPPRPPHARVRAGPARDLGRVGER